MRGRDRDAETVEVARFRFRWEAEMAAGTLADMGLPAVVVGDDVGGMYPGVMSVAVRVARADAERAREALEGVAPPEANAAETSDEEDR